MSVGVMSPSKVQSLAPTAAMRDLNAAREWLTANVLSETR
jgi:hypothetical protein